MVVILVTIVHVCCIDPLFSSHVQNEWTALMRAACGGHTAIVQYLVEETTAQVNATDSVSHSNSVTCVQVSIFNPTFKYLHCNCSGNYSQVKLFRN